MPNTRKRPVKPPEFKDDSDASEENEFSDSGSEASLCEGSDSSSDEENELSSGDDFKNVNRTKSFKTFTSKPVNIKKKNTVKSLFAQVSKSSFNQLESIPEPAFSMKDLTEQDKLLPAVLDLSESDSEESDSDKPGTSKKIPRAPPVNLHLNEKRKPAYGVTPKEEFSKVESSIVGGVSRLSNSSDDDDLDDVNCINDIKSETHKKLNFEHLNDQAQAIEDAKASFLKYESKRGKKEKNDIDVGQLLALGETSKQLHLKADEVPSSESEKDDWEEVKDSKPNIPKEGIQLVVDIPSRKQKSKILDVEMMMKRKINRVKKEYQVYMHKVHVLCWLGHGNYVNRVLNEQELMAAVLSLIPSKHCYPSNRVDIKYLEQVSHWYRETMILNQDKHEDKFRPKAPPLLVSLLKQVKEKAVTTNKNLVLIFVSMLRALGIKCRLVLSFKVIPLRPPTSELCSLAQKEKPDFSKGQANKKDNDIKSKHFNRFDENNKPKLSKRSKDGNGSKQKNKMSNIPQIDGADDDKLPSTRRRKRAVNENNVKECTKSSASNSKTDKIVKNNVIKSKINLNVAEKDPCKNQPEKSYWDSLMEKQGVDNAGLQSSQRTSHRDLRARMSTSKATNTKDIAVNDCKPSTASKIEKTEPTAISRASKKSSRLSLRSKENLNDQKINVSNGQNKLDEVPNKGPIKLKENNIAKKVAKRISVPSPKTEIPLKKSKPLAKDVNRGASSSNNASGKRISKVASKYFSDEDKTVGKKNIPLQNKNKQNADNARVSHKDLVKSPDVSVPKADVKEDNIGIVKDRIRQIKSFANKKLAKGKVKAEDDNDSDYLTEDEMPSKKKTRNSIDSENDFLPPKRKSKPPSKGKKDRRVLSSDDEDGNVGRKGLDAWCEVYVEEEEQWISVDVVKAQVHCVNLNYSRASHPVTYVVTWDEACYVKDVTRRYVPHFATSTRKLRTQPEWWSRALQPWLPPQNALQKREDELLDRQQLDAPLPKTVGEYKNHPLYALKRHLLKFEAIYPPEAATLGFVRGEPVYSRDCVFVLRSRETWLKEARVVKPAQTPYKQVKARPKWDKISMSIVQPDQPLDVFGFWQTDEYDPPRAENGIVPRNAYGNVELYKPQMLPKGTVHLQLPSLHKVARKLQIDCANAMTGFDTHGGWPHPVYDGFVVCEEFKDILIDAWEKDQEECEKRERERIENRVYGNWKRLIKGLLIRERLKAKYDFDDPHATSASASANAADKKKKIKKK